MAKTLHLLVIEALGLHHYVAHLVNSVSKYCEVDVLGCSRKYIRNIKFYSIFPESFLGDNARIPPLLLTFMALFYTPVRLAYLLQKKKYDIVHVQGHVPWLFWFFPLARKRKSVMIWTIHDPVYRPSHAGMKGPFESMYIRLTCLPRLLMKHSDFVIVHGKKLSKLLEKWGVDSFRIKVLPHGNFSILRRIGNNEPGKHRRGYVLFFGKIKPYKGIETIIRAVPIIKKEIKDVLIVIAGYGKIDKYLSLVKEEDMKNFEIDNHYIPDENISSLFRNAALVVLPYYEASQSGVLCLAYTFGKPVVVSRAGSMNEYVDEKTTGFTFKRGDYTSLAEFVIDLLKNEKLRRKMERHCYEKAFSELSWKNIALDTYKTYKEALCARAR